MAAMAAGGALWGGRLRIAREGALEELELHRAGGDPVGGEGAVGSGSGGTSEAGEWFM